MYTQVKSDQRPKIFFYIMDTEYDLEISYLLLHWTELNSDDELTLGRHSFQYISFQSSQ